MESLIRFFFNDALAQQAATQTPGEMGFLNLLFPIILIAAFYFLLIRPQTQRAKEHKNMVDSIKKGDEIVTGGGVLGRVIDTGANFLLIEVAENTQLKVQKHSVGSLMPKGTYKGKL